MRPRSARVTFLVLATSLGAFVACATQPSPETSRPVPPPAKLDGKAFDAAASVQLPPTQPKDSAGLHNVFHLSPNIVSGSEPHGEAALEEIARMGVKTVISVDGQAPDHERARKHGLRYVHVPIQYKGITEDEVLKIAKTFRETEGPFYVHCFHGKHRGPAAAAIGRVVLDGASRETAVAEMRQWCGTAPEYEGLYRCILTQEMPAAAKTSAYAYDFSPEARFAGFRAAMVQVSRAHDHIQDLLKQPKLVDPDHPDLDVVNECRKLLGAFEGSMGFPEVKDGKDDMRGWMQGSVEGTRTLLASLTAAKAGDATARTKAEADFKRVRSLCTQCHKVHRNE